MRVKRYVVSELPEAISMIRSDLGKDAVILNTKEIRVGGFMGMFRKRRMEVLAAVESGASAAAAAESAMPVQRQAAGVPSVQTAVPADAWRPAATAVLDASSPMSPRTRSSGKVEGQERLLEELKGIRQFMSQLSARQTSEGGLPDPEPEPFRELRRRLEEQEVAEELREKLIAEIRDQNEDRRLVLSREEVWEAAREALLDWLEPFKAEPVAERTRVVHFVGPTGVGKTTTIAKLAAEQSIKRGRRLGFVTSDTYRIAAVEQLRTYANILDIPLEVVFSPLDLERAFGRLEDRDLIFMDTAGRNFRSQLHVSEVNSLFRAGADSETVLLFSMTGKTKDMASVAEHFGKFGVRKVLFTKLDETTVYGAILNLVLSFGLIPTYVASGQTVPDDIEPFDADRYVGMLLGGISYE